MSYKAISNRQLIAWTLAIVAVLIAILLIFGDG
jgi:hypothetical protein